MRYTARWLLIALLLPLTAVAANALKGHPSPYLALHGDDPVQWRDWGAKALEESRKQGLPLFVSSGYFACHWCHVMQQQSFQDAEVAALLNARFIPVKVDRELHPALDEHMIRFVERTRGQAGWPLNVFLTPEGYPLLGLTYLPRDDFMSVLSRIAERWQERSDSLSSLAREASAQLVAERQQPKRSAPPPPERVADALIRSALSLGDELAGGFGNQSRFPMEPQLLALLALSRSDEANAALEPFLRVTLDEMARRGLRDHLAGGFFRYTVDPDWRTPHYEKMLYNQALLARVYLLAAEVFGEPGYADVAAETLDFVIARMGGTDGGYIASLSAVDSAGEEGGSYLWDEASLAKALKPDEIPLASAWWSLESGVSTESGWLPQRLRTLPEVAEITGLDDSEIQKMVPVLRQQLLKQRDDRLPPRDDKQLAAWNGLLLSAFSDMVRVNDQERYRRAAEELAGFLGTLWDGERLYRARSGVRILGEAGLEDYAYVASGLADWARQSGDADVAAFSHRVAAAGWSKFFDGEGWRIDANPLIPDMPRDPALPDGALPSPSAVLMAMSQGQSPSIVGAQPSLALELSVTSVEEAPFWNASHAMVMWGSSCGERPVE